jgi:hypothetical protein
MTIRRVRGKDDQSAFDFVQQYRAIKMAVVQTVESTVSEIGNLLWTSCGFRYHSWTHNDLLCHLCGINGDLVKRANCVTTRVERRRSEMEAIVSRPRGEDSTRTSCDIFVYL